jgi:hypothetical protein
VAGGAVVVVVAGGVVVVAAVVGGCTAGSDFSPQPAAANAVSAPATSTSAKERRLPASGSEFTAGTVTRAGNPCRPGTAKYG